MFLARARDGSDAVAAVRCSSTAACGDAIVWDLGRVNETVAQIRDAGNASSCLAYDGGALHMEACRVEVGDGANATDCRKNNCRFSSLTDELFYLNAREQLVLGWTNFQAPRGAAPRVAAKNIPMCLVARGGAQQGPSPSPPSPAVDDTLPLQVWAGPLVGGDIVVVLLNAGNVTANITATWADVGLPHGVAATVTDLFAPRAGPAGGGERAAVDAQGSISAAVATHDVAAFRLKPVKC
jgi:hypothetical protein